LNNRARRWVAVLVLAMGVLCVTAAAEQAEDAKITAAAAVVRHIASSVVGNPPQRTYLAYFGKRPPESLWRLVQDIPGLRPIPDRWRVGDTDDPSQLLDVRRVKRAKSMAVLVTASVTGTLGFGLDDCTYEARRRDGAWQVESGATRCAIF